ncbi:MAG: F0F1 ATP synthase subunit B [Elusimicrobia bacterium]|nr:F0F1 ATP synthase subunit B [Elusimicrobiota bacterium]
MEHEATTNTGLWVTIFNVISFAVVVFVLGKFGWPAILSALKTREDQIRKDLEAAQKAREEAEASRRELERSLAALESKAQEIVQEAKKKGEQTQAALLREAQQGAKELMEKTKSQMSQERQKLLVSLRSEMGTLVALATERILKRKADHSLHADLVEESLKELEKMSKDAS